MDDFLKNTLPGVTDKLSKKVMGPSSVLATVGLLEVLDLDTLILATVAFAELEML
jgi:hypothetical protein